MPFQGSDGTWWSDDRRYYRAGDQWILYQKASSSGASSQQDQSSSQQASSTGTPLGTVAASNVAAALSTFPQTSTAPYQQQPQLVFGKNRQTPGEAAVPAITLDPKFRDAASRNLMIWGFTKGMDDMANGRA
ncbi:hypothetical protein K469DRAFT_90124 [Zopfia rhizophila CBS 207.26]|uniref:Uncharacterized protein n=1 Tax=Zopfia rhizophila CBS 207.26 TaxID=1314779 RepID=A0A6A6E8M2_9PEZI|nr:hypothetical protein K469DRAFT_90124 [Zopfia rhizophila CBS 207.26]